MDILSTVDISEFCQNVNRPLYSQDDCVYPIDFNKLERIYSIIDSFAKISDGDFFGFSLIPDNCDALLRIRCGSLLIDGEEITSLPLIKKKFQDVAQMNIRLMSPHFLIEFRISDFYQKTRVEDVF